jgi:DNA-binding transcriptional regulator YdaS (Cro superfamily)
LITNLYWLRVAIQICGSREELAKRAHIKKGRITEWLNQTRKISLLYAIKIEMAVEGKVNRLDLVTVLDSKVRRYLQAEQEKIQLAKPKLSLTEQVTLGLALEKALIDLKTIKNPRQPCENFHKVTPGFAFLLADVHDQSESKSRTDDLIARRVGFGNYRTYRDAKDIVATNIPKLIAAVDCAKISIYRAAQIIRYPENKRGIFLKLLNNKKQLIKEMEKHPLMLTDKKALKQQSVPLPDDSGMAYAQSSSIYSK